MRFNSWGRMLAVLWITVSAQAAAVCLPQEPPRVISGGVGETELQALRDAEPGYNLKLVFTLEGGQHVTGVDVEIRGAEPDWVLRHHARGPWLLACLPVGIYMVSVEYEGLRQSRPLKMGKALRTAYFRWAAGPDDVVLKPEPTGR
jgi:hypothetical protein